MKTMGEHATNLAWAASWFRFLTHLVTVIAVVSAIFQILLWIFTDQLYENVASSTVHSLLALNLVGLFIGSLFSIFFFRVGNIICSFLADFAQDLYSEQVRHDRESKQSRGT